MNRSERIRGLGIATAVALLWAALPPIGSAMGEAALPRYEVVGDGIPVSLTGTPGNSARGREIMVNRQLGSCLLCHAGPFPEEQFQGNIGPDLHGVGARLSRDQLRLRVVDTSRLNQDTVMPSVLPHRRPHSRHQSLGRAPAAQRRAGRGRGRLPGHAAHAMMQRRFLLAAGGLALVILPPAIARATPAQLAAAMREVLGEAAPRPGRVKLDIPLMVENGNAVPMTVSVDGTDDRPEPCAASTCSPRPTRCPTWRVSASGPAPARHALPPASGWPRRRP